MDKIKTPIITIMLSVIIIAGLTMRLVHVNNAAKQSRLEFMTSIDGLKNDIAVKQKIITDFYARCGPEPAAL